MILRISIFLLSVIIYSYSGIAQTPGNYFIESGFSGKYLDVRAAKKTDGTPIQIWAGNKTPQQTFKLINAGGGYFFIESLGKYVQVRNASRSTKARVEIGPRLSKDKTKWKLTSAGGGFYYIQSKLGTFLDVQNGINKNGTAIWTWTKNGTTAQKWKLKPKGAIQNSGNLQINMAQTSHTVPPVSNKVMTNFKPEKHGFKFVNYFSNHGFAAGAHINFGGLCGGMSYAALDYYFTNTAIPSQTSTPKEGTQLTRFIRSRQWKTYSTQGDKWVELGFNPFGERTREFWNWGVQGFNGGRFQELKREIDKGRPVVLGLFAAGGGGFTSSHHQVVAIGYDAGRYKGDLKNYKDDLKIFIYDPNYPNKIMTLRPNSAKLRYCYTGKNKEWLTYFVDRRYKSVRPLDPSVINQCTSTNFENKKLNGKTYNNKNFRCAKASGVQFRGATISGTDFEDAELDRAYFYGANCQHTNFSYSSLNNADFQGADLKNCNFSNVQLKSTRFYGADLKVAILDFVNAENANFQGADLHKALLRNACLKKARFYRASLNSANCEGADFSNANLDGADLRGAILNGANFKNAVITRHTKYDRDIVSKVKNWPGQR